MIRAWYQAAAAGSAFPGGGNQTGLLAFSAIAIDDDIAAGAMNEPDRALRSLDAIHLATARVLAPDLDAVVSYDDHLIKAATDAGLATVSPRD